MSEELEKLKRHLGRPVPISITNQEGVTDTFYLKPLTITQQAILMELGKTIIGRGEVEIEIEEDGKIIKKKVPNTTKEDMNEMFELIKDIVRNSIKGLDEETLEEFCNNNFERLSESLEKLSPENKNKKELDTLRLAKERIESGQQK